MNATKPVGGYLYRVEHTYDRTPPIGCPPAPPPDHRWSAEHTHIPENYTDLLFEWLINTPAWSAISSVVADPAIRLAGLTESLDSCQSIRDEWRFWVSVQSGPTTTSDNWERYTDEVFFAVNSDGTRAALLVMEFNEDDGDE